MINIIIAIANIIVAFMAVRTWRDNQKQSKKTSMLHSKELKEMQRQTDVMKEQRQDSRLYNENNFHFQIYPYIKLEAAPFDYTKNNVVLKVTNIGTGIAENFSCEIKEDDEWLPLVGASEKMFVTNMLEIGDSFNISIEYKNFVIEMGKERGEYCIAVFYSDILARRYRKEFSIIVINKEVANIDPRGPVEIVKPDYHVSPTPEFLP